MLSTAGEGQEPAGPRADLRGVVVAEEGGSPLPAVVVHVVETGAEVLTDDAGGFVLRALPAGAYTLRFSQLGRVHHEEMVRVPRTPGGLRIVLGTAALELSPILVLHRRTRMVGDRALAEELPGSAHFISRSQVESRRLLFDDVHQVLREIPGVNVQEEEGFGLRPNIGFRGTGSERSDKITVMEDGVLIAPAPYAAPAAYYFPVTGRMEAVEVRKGSSQIRYGPRTIGGALNLISSPVPRELGMEAEVVGGGNATGKMRVRAGDSYNHVGWMLETYQLRSGGFKELDGGGDTGFRIQDYVGKVRLSTDPRAPGAYHEVELKGGVYDQRSNETYLGLTAQDFASEPLRRYSASREDVMRADHTQGQLRYFGQLHPRVDVTTTLYRNGFSRNWYKLQSVRGRSLGAVLEDPELFAEELAILRGAVSEDGALRVRANNRSYYSAGIQGTVGLRFTALGVSHDVEVGVRYHEDQEDRFQHEDAFRMSGGGMVLTAAGAPGSQENRVNDAAAWAVHVQDRVVSGPLTVTPGLRWERIAFTRTDYATDDPVRLQPTRVRENSVDVLIPGVGLNYLLRPDVRLFAGVHRGFGAPGPGADRSTRPELSVNYEVGARLGRAVGAQVTFFFSDYTNILGAATLSSGTDGSGELYNGGAVQVRGVELSAEGDVLGGRSGGLEVPARLAYTLTEGEFKTSFRSDYEPWGTVRAGDGLPYLAPHQLAASLGLVRAEWALRVGARYSGAMRTRAGRGPIGEGEGTDAFVVLDFSGEYGVSPRGALTFGVENLTDARYVAALRPAGARPGLPRTFQAGFRVRR